VVDSGPLSPVDVSTEVTLVLPDGSYESAAIRLVEDFADPLWVHWAGVVLSTSSLRDFHGWSWDFFEALRQVRRDLDLLGALVLVNGARVDAWPSGLQSSMHLARGVYLFAPQADQGQVRLLDPAEPSQVGTVAEQDSYCDARTSR